MDTERFDAVARSLSHAASRRTILGIVAGALGSLLGRADADAKKKGKKKRKEPCGLCQIKKKGKCKGKKPDGTACRDGTCLNGACTSGCMAEPPAQTCAGRCGTRTNACGQAVACPPCSAGRACLDNGSCAITCDPDGASGCGDGGICSCFTTTNTEGQRHCVALTGFCAELPRCDSTAECPRGTHCQTCSGHGTRCIRLCGCVDDTDCSGSQQCSNGECGDPPDCKSRSSCCTDGQHDECCSGVCVGSAGCHTCKCSDSGQTCNLDADCCVGPCVGFVCQE